MSMKCSGTTFIAGLILGALTGVVAERYTRTTSRGRQIRREVNRAILDLYGSAEQQLGRVKEFTREHVPAVGKKTEVAE
ncbi:YtxH domain-containing protein [Muribaculum intestinale]|uniref:YtxH domain-containing protein n=2 Tax=Muribaculum intestinale TaxID=1796646 RepID=A0A4V3RT28_9BACT|nr:YtxH domain-containing protein [Muribaculum intestinale]TGY68239.1 YtxH domain-containing protein [Muribaculum intestinale]